MHRTLVGGAAVLLLTAGIAASGVSPAPAAAHAPAPEYGRLMLLLDSSGSMAEPASGGQTKIQAAKQALGRVIDDLPDDAQVGLRVFGAKVFSRKDPGACTDTQLVVEPGTDNRDQLRDAVGDYQPYGETPIPAALKAAAADLGDEGARSIVLVSDGESTCAPDPCDVARQLASKGINLQIDVVGLSVSGKAREQLQCIADAGHGTYYDADDAQDIEGNLVHVAERALRPFTLDGTPIEGGPQSAPTPVTVGEWIDALGPVGSPQESRSFAFDRTTDGSTLRVTALTQGEKGDDGIKVEIADPAGKVCNAGQVTRQFDTRDILAAEAVATPDVDGCGAPGKYRITVTRMTGSETEVPFGLRVSEEPPVTDPGPAATDDTELTAPHVSGPATDVPGGASFANADEITDGKWSSTLVPGESLLYGFHLDFGQAARISVEFPDGTPAMKDVVGTTPPEARLALFNPMHAALAYPNVGQVPIGSVVTQRQDLLTATSTVSRGALDVSPFVGSVNGVKDTSMAGEYYLGVSMQAADYDLEVPFTISIEVVGEPGPGPAYADGADWDVEDGLTAGTTTQPSDSATASPTSGDDTSASSGGDHGDDGGPGGTVAVAGVAGVGGLAALAAAFVLWRRRGGQGPA